MKIKKLYAENIYSFSKLSVDFLEFAGVVSIILGKNIDQRTANGAGKTSILKALYWALWNKELNGETIERMINWMNPEAGMLAVLEFEDRGYEYKVTRYKNYRPHKNSPKFHDGTPVSGSGVEFLVNGNPLMGDSHVKTQLIIEQKLKMTPRLFLSCVLMAQKSKTHFLTANDTDKKEILSELLDLQAYEKAFKTIKDSIKEVEDRIGLNENKIENLQEQIAQNEGQIIQLSDNESAYVLDTNSKLAKFDLEIKVYEQNIIELNKIAQEKDLSEEIRKKISGVEEKIKELKEQLKSEVSIIEALTRLESDLKNKQLVCEESINHLTNLKNQKEDLVKKLSNFTILDLSDKKLDLEHQISNQKNIIEEIKKQINKEQVWFLEKNQIESKISKNIELLTETESHINDAKNNTLCPTCLRGFQPGESASLDQVLNKFNKEKELLNLKAIELENQLTEIKNKLLSLDSIKSSLKLAENKMVDFISEQNNLIKQEQDFKLLQKDQFLWSEQLKNLDSEVIKTESNVQNLSKQIKILEKKQLEVQKLKEDLIPVKQKLNELENSISDQRKELLKSEGNSIRIQQAKRELDEKKQLLKITIENKEELKAKPNPYTAMKKNLQNMVSTFKERLAKHKTLVQESQEELKYLNFWKTGFSPIGIRSFITDDVIELLNRKTQENLDELFDGAITVLFDPESKNNKGVVSNKISTTFLYNGKETTFALLSGGEQQRAILATELALTEVAEARAGTKLNLRFLDEPFDGMDNNGQIKSLSLFAKMAKDKDGFFVISHDENFQHLCQKSLFVLKKKEVSYIVDKATFNSAEIDEADMSAGYEEGENLHLINPTSGTGKSIDLSKALKKKKQQLEDDDD